MNSRIGITGLGMISAIGDHIAGNLQALRRGDSGISTLHFQKTKHAEDLLYGEVPHSTAELAIAAGVVGQPLSRSAMLALLAFREAIAHAGISSAQLQDSRTALVCGATVGGICQGEELFRDVSEGETPSDFIDQYDTYAVTEAIRFRHGMNGLNATINTACSSSANAIQYGARLIRSGMADRVIVGGADAIAKFTINGFHALRLLSATACRPFDAERDGLNIGEGAAFLVMERESLMGDKVPLAWFTGYGNANDAFHPTSLGPEGHGPMTAMARALSNAGITAKDIDCVHAHGTGTENNDQVESLALAMTFGGHVPYFSTKGATGHTLGAAGAMGAIVSVLSLLHQEVYPSVGFTQDMPESNHGPNRQHRSQLIRHAMANAFGFGGNCTSLIFSRS